MLILMMEIMCTQDDGWLLDGDGFPKERFPNHWKGKNGVYCAGLGRRGLAGVSMDAQMIANDIDKLYVRDQGQHLKNYTDA